MLVAVGCVEGIRDLVQVGFPQILTGARGGGYYYDGGERGGPVVLPEAGPVKGAALVEVTTPVTTGFDSVYLLLVLLL